MSGSRWRMLFAAALAGACSSRSDTADFRSASRSPALTSGPELLQQRGDLARTGWNSSEAILTPANVNVATFGKLFTLPVDGYVYAQPLYKANVVIQGTPHNVLVVATEHASLNAFDADVGTSLWRTSFINPPSVTTQPAGDTGTTDIVPEVGITGTPAIDPATGTIYVVSKTKESGTPVFRIHAIDVASGGEKLTPVKIQPAVSGNGTGSSGGTITLNAAWQQQRSGLTLVNGVVYAAFGSSGDNFTWHGWLAGYRAADLSLASALNVSANGNGVGIWMPSQAPAVDSAGNLYVLTGNGDFNGTSNFGDSVLKVGTSAGLQVVDFFAPFNQAALSSADLDFGSAGIILLPDAAGTAAHPHLVVTTGKSGTIYLLDRDGLGGYRSSYSTPDNQILQEIWNALGANRIDNTASSLPYVENSYTTPAYFRDSNGADHLYFGGVSDTVKMFDLVNGLIATTPVSHSAASYGFPGASPVVSSSGSANAIVWAYERGATLATLHAYDAQNLANELYNSGQAANNRDLAGAPVKFCVPTVTNGRVYIGLQGKVAVYGLLSSAPQQAAAPVFSPTGGNYPSGVTVAISTTTSGATIYYTTDGSLPNVNSNVYSGPITITSTTSINAVAVANGLLDSSFSTATYTTGTAPPAAFVQGAYAVPQTPQSSVGVTYGLSQGAGDLNVVIVGWNGSSSVSSVSDTMGTQYVLAVGPHNNSVNDHQSIYYARNVPAAVPGSNMVTVNFSAPANFPDIRILEYSGLDTVAPVDGTAGSSGNSATSNSGTLTTTNANDFLVAGNVVQTQTTGAGSGFTSRMITNPDGDVAEDRLISTTGSYSATAALSASGPWVMQLVAFKVASASPPGPPTAPANLTATGTGSTQIDLSWTNTSPTQTGVKIERSPDGLSFSQIALAAPTATTYSDTGLIASTTYSYRVRATNSSGDSSYSNVATATTQPPPLPPTAPTNLVANAVSNSEIDLTWTNTSSGTSDHEHVAVERSTDNVDFVLVNTLGGTFTSYSDTGLGASTTYWYRVRATNSAGASPYSNIAGATTFAVTPPSAPTNLAATAVSATQINLSWNNTSTAQTGVKVERSTDAVNFAQIAVTPATANSYSDGSVAASTGYWYRVRATSGSGDSAYSNVANATTLAPPPALAFVQVASADPQTAQSTVSVAYASAQSAGDLNVVIAGWNDSTATVTGVTDSSGNSYSLAVGPTVQSGVATQSIYFAKNIRPAAAGANVVKVQFSVAARFPDIRILEYRGVDPTSPFDVAVAATGNSSSSSSGALTTTNANDLIVAGNVVQTGTTAAGSGFTRRVITSPDGDIAEDRIVSSVGSYTASAPLSLSGQWIMQAVAFKGGSAPPPPPPAAPANLTATAVSTTEIDLSWTNGSTSQTGVRIERSPDGVTFTQIAVTAATATSFADAGLIAAVTYSYRLRATNGVTDSPYTPVATATTFPLSPPANLTATAVSSSVIALGWTNTNPNQSGTKIERSGDGVTFTQVAVAAAGATTYADQGLAPSATYWYRLRATNFTTDSAYTAAVSAATQPLAAPANVTATAASSGEVDLAWTNTNANQTGVKIERSTDGTTFTLLATAPATATGYNDAGLLASTTYFYQLRATNGPLDSVPSAVVSATTLAPALPAPPANLIASASSSSRIDLTWVNTSPSGGQSAVKIERSLDGNTFAQIAQTASATATTYSDTGLTASTTYWYRVRATNGSVDSAYSAVASAKTQAGTPAPITFVQVNSADPQTAQASVSVTFTSSQAAGDLNLVIVGWNDTSATVTSVTDTMNNAYVRAVGPTIQSGVATQSIYYAKNVAAAAAGANAVKVQFSVGARYPDVRILSYRGIDPSNPLDVTAAATGSSASSSSGAVTTTNANDLIVGANLVQTMTTAAGTSFTRRVITSPDGDIAEDRIVSATGSYSATAPLSPSGQWIMQLVSFKAAIR
jgi:Chitobiase/beta-hexosaminidase C-terminal domain/Fibronectin type III domain